MNEPQKNYNLLKAIEQIHGTQEAFATVMNINPARISRTVNGIEILTSEQKRAWAKALKTTIGYLWPDPDLK